MAAKVILDPESKWQNVWEVWIQIWAYNELCMAEKPEKQQWREADPQELRMAEMPDTGVSAGQ